MQKSDLVVKIAEEAGISKAAADRALDSLLGNLSKALKKGDRDSYLGQEKLIRENAGLPPYGRLAAIIVSGGDANETERFARAIGRTAPRAEGVAVLGPAPAPIHLVRGRHRWRFLVKVGREVNIQNFLRQWLKEVKPKGSLHLAIDVDPYSFL